MTRRLISSALTIVLAVMAILGTLLSAPAHAGVPSEKQWLADVNKALHGSRVYVDQQVDSGGHGLAINLDIDNTSLASHYSYGDAVARVLRLARHAHAQNVAILFNTGRIRGGGRLAAAAQQLTDAGYTVDEVCGRTSAKEGLGHSKRRCRRHFVAEGYTIIANVGNRSTDFEGGHYRRAFRLPSYGDQLA